MENAAESADRSRQMSGKSALSDLFFRVPVALYRTDEKGDLLTANQALANLLGYANLDELEAARGSVSSFYVDPAGRDKWLSEINEKGLVFDFDVELRRADGSTIWVEDTARAIRDDQGKLLYYEGALIDVTEKVQATRARDEFLATVSHELRNPIAVVVGLSHELADRYESFEDEERREMSDMIARQADDASWLIEDLLVAYRDDVTQVAVSSEKFDIVSDLKTILNVAQREIPLEMSVSAARVIADPRRTRQIMRNLVNNAVNHGGDEIRARVVVGEDLVEVRVCDNGSPISDSEVREIFQAFKRGSQATHPTSVGLGLPVARELARLMGGDVTYAHRDGYSTFTLSLPRPPDEASD